jgi:hypothetical protein
MKKEVSRIDRVIAWIVDCMFCGVLSYFLTSIYCSSWGSIHSLATQITPMYFIFFVLLLFKDYINHYIPFLLGEKIASYKVETQKPFQLIIKNLSFLFGPFAFFYFLIKKRVFNEDGVVYAKKKTNLLYLFIYWIIFLFLIGYTYDNSNRIFFAKNQAFDSVIHEIEQDSSIVNFNSFPKGYSIDMTEKGSFVRFQMRVCSDTSCKVKEYRRNLKIR